tara:strand:- start:115 stop:285 length:171 start_codon:yes stop_codon:yes gene_type:complete
MRKSKKDELPLFERLKLASLFQAGYQLDPKEVQWVYNALKKLRFGRPINQRDTNPE